MHQSPFDLFAQNQSSQFAEAGVETPLQSLTRGGIDVIRETRAGSYSEFGQDEGPPGRDRQREALFGGLDLGLHHHDVLPARIAWSARRPSGS